MRKFWKILSKVALILVGGATLVTVIYIMANGLGLNPDLDFGAGAYYYADIPDFDKTPEPKYSTSIPVWVHILLFLVWGALMYWLWTWIDRKK